LSFESFVALRYLAASRQRAHVALIATISVLGLAIGVAALVVSLALLSGFQDRIQVQMAEKTPHLRVSAARGALLPDTEAVRAALSALPDVTQVEPAVEGRGWLSDADGMTATPVRFKSAGQGSLPANEDGPPPARLAGSVAGRTGSRIGSLVRLTSSRSRLAPIGPIPIAMVFRVSDVRRSSALDRAAEVEIPEGAARLLAALPSGAPAYTARLTSADRAGEAARAVAAALGPQYRVQTWRELNASLGFALRLEKLVIFVTVALVILVAALNIVSNIALLVVEKKRDLGVFATLGASPGMLARVYLALGLCVGTLGTGLGLAAGSGLAWLFDRYGLVPLPADVYMLSHVPFTLHPMELAVVAIFAMGTALAAAALPARAAARLAPGEAIRLSR
jgi:lipoprotein-releasing system permease protein